MRSPSRNSLRTNRKSRRSKTPASPKAIKFDQEEDDADLPDPTAAASDAPWAATSLRIRLDIACHIRRELIAAGQERTKNGWRGPTPPGRNVRFTLRRFWPLDGGNLYNGPSLGL